MEKSKEPAQIIVRHLSLEEGSWQEMVSRGARTLVVNLDEKKVLSSDCTICFATLNRHINAYVKGAASVGTGGLSGIGNPQMPVTKSRKESRFKDCTEGHAPKKARVGPAE